MDLTRARRRKCASAGRVTANLLLSFLALSARSVGASSEQIPLLEPIPWAPGLLARPEHTAHQFSLRHIFHHGTHKHPNLHRKKDVHKEAPLYVLSESGEKELITSLPALSRFSDIQRLKDRRPSSVDPMVAAAREQDEVWALSPSAWTVDSVAGPNVTDKETVVSLALMAANAYIELRHTEDWEDVKHGFNTSTDFGWEGDGLRGHIFADENNSTVVIGLKGTSPAVFDGAETTTNDKINDNLFASCCCAQQGQWSWRQVCDCASGTYSCNNTCVSMAIREESRYYQAVRNLYSNVTELYPKSQVWVTGHSLGGAVSSLLGMTYGLPTVTFEAVPDALAASRLGLPPPPGSDPGYPQTRHLTGSFHFGHTADPIFMGTCNGATSTCSFAGYAMESVCHTGKRCVYDVVADKGWRVGIGTHKIRSVIRDVIRAYDAVPECVPDLECKDCYNWKYYESNGTERTTTSTTSTTSKTMTRTATCATPGWWGCLDESTTTSTTTTSLIITTITTTTCLTPGWFGCRDTSTVSTTITSTLVPTTTCEHPGYFGGCNNPTTTTTTAEPTPTCKTPGVIYGCRDTTTTSATTTLSHPITSAPALPTNSAGPTPVPTDASIKKHYHCAEKGWLGWCKMWEWRELFDGGGEEEGRQEI